MPCLQRKPRPSPLNNAAPVKLQELDKWWGGVLYCWCWGWVWSTATLTTVHTPSHRLCPGGREGGGALHSASATSLKSPHMGARGGWGSDGGLEYAGAGKHVLLSARKPADESKETCRREQGNLFLYLSVCLSACLPVCHCMLVLLPVCCLPACLEAI